MMKQIYDFLTGPAGFWMKSWLRLRARKGKEEPDRLQERTGRATLPRPEGPLIWIHGASIGEILSALPLAEKILEQDPRPNILLTSGTRSSARIISRQLDNHQARARMFHQFIPLDRPDWIRRFLNHWQPDAAIWVESDLWPHALVQLRKKGIPAALINARMSERSARRWQRFAPSWARQILKTFSVIVAQTENDKARFERLAQHTVRLAPTLKYAQASHGGASFKQMAPALHQALQERSIWLAASTHAGEEAAAARIHRRLKNDIPDLLTIILPRHPERCHAIEAELPRELRIAWRSGADIPDSNTDIYIADTFGETPMFYARAPVVLAGKTLFPPGGGQNPIEPARQGCAVIMGPYRQFFETVARDFFVHKAALSVTDEEELYHTLLRLFKNPEEAQKLGRNARQWVESQASSALDTTWHAIKPVLPAQTFKREPYENT